MSNPYFRFKQFTIYHDRCAMKVGTDGVLLGAWANVGKCDTILDVGTGSGLIALMLAQRGGECIDAVEIDRNAAEQAAENVCRSPFAGKVHILHTSFVEYSSRTSVRYDLIVSNPPYFIDALRPENKQRLMARHTDELSYEELVTGVCTLLNDDGRFALILPCDHFERFSRLACDAGLNLARKTLVCPTPLSQPRRILMEWSRLQEDCRNDTLTIETARHCYTDDFNTLTKEFYLDR